MAIGAALVGLAPICPGWCTSLMPRSRRRWDMARSPVRDHNVERGHVGAVDGASGDLGANQHLGGAALASDARGDRAAYPPVVEVEVLAVLRVTVTWLLVVENRNSASSPSKV